MTSSVTSSKNNGSSSGGSTLTPKQYSAGLVRKGATGAVSSQQQHSQTMPAAVATSPLGPSPNSSTSAANNSGHYSSSMTSSSSISGCSSSSTRQKGCIQVRMLLSATVTSQIGKWMKIQTNLIQLELP